jgi:Peptidase A4 family
VAAPGCLYLANETTGKNCQITLMPPTGASSNGSTIEWIMEATAINGVVSSLPSFSPVQLRAAGCGPGITANPQNGDYGNITDQFGPPYPPLLTSVTLGNDGVTIDFTG